MKISGKQLERMLDWSVMASRREESNWSVRRRSDLKKNVAVGQTAVAQGPPSASEIYVNDRPRWEVWLGRHIL